MYKIISMILVIQSTVLFSQETSNPIQVNDPMVAFGMKMHRMNNFSYDATYRHKGMFEDDTMVIHAHARVVKKGTKIISCRLTMDDSSNELLFLNDSAWTVNHVTGECMFIGNEINMLAGNVLFELMPLNLFSLDSSLIDATPHWEVIRENGGRKTVRVHIAEIPPELSELKVEVEIDMTDSTLCAITQEAILSNPAVVLYQEKTFRNFRANIEKDIRFPALANRHTIILPGPDNPPVQEKDDATAERPAVYLTGLDLRDLDGNPYYLPEDGQVFIDLWYVGCLPCLKSAPVIEKIYHEFKDRIHFLTINEVDKDTSRIKQFVRQMAVTFPVTLNRGEKITSQIGENGYPAFILFDAATASVDWHSGGFRDDLENYLRQVIFEFLE